MKVPDKADWDVSPEQAVKIQKDLAPRVSKHDELGPIKLVAGVDVGFEGPQNKTARSAVVILDFPDLDLVEYKVARKPVSFPYIPGLLAFRECPVILDALAQIEHAPDVLIVDGHGYAHPRRFGITSYLGVLIDKPTIGCAKSRLVGQYEMPTNEKGAWTPLTDRGEVIGGVLRTRANVTPIFVSIGHRVSLETAVRLVLQCTRGYRLPETTRYAHRAAGGEDLEANAP